MHNINVSNCHHFCFSFGPGFFDTQIQIHDIPQKNHLRSCVLFWAAEPDFNFIWGFESRLNMCLIYIFFWHKARRGTKSLRFFFPG